MLFGISLKVGLFNIVSCVLLLASVALFSVLYVAQEQSFYSSDFVNHQLFAEYPVSIDERSPQTGFSVAIESRQSKFDNRLFALPIAPKLAQFGTSRWVYVLSLTIADLLPFSLSLAAVACSSPPPSRRRGGACRIRVAWRWSVLASSLTCAARGLPPKLGSWWVWGLSLLWVEPLNETEVVRRRVTTACASGTLTWELWNGAGDRARIQPHLS